LARTQPATLDAAGAARLTVGGLPTGDALQALRLELDYQDANRATQTGIAPRDVVAGAAHSGHRHRRLERARYACATRSR